MVIAETTASDAANAVVEADAVLEAGAEVVAAAVVEFVAPVVAPVGELDTIVSAQTPAILSSIVPAGVVYIKSNLVCPVNCERGVSTGIAADLEGPASSCIVTAL